MKRFLEIIEIAEGETPEYIYCEITDKTDIEILEIRKKMEDIMSGTQYILRDHACGHDKRGTCVMERLV